MTEPDFRALCAELLDCDDGAIFGTDLIARARAALAQPEPQGPSDKEWDELWDEEAEYFALYAEARRFGRAVLARYGRPAIEPVPPAAPVVQAIKRSVSSGLKPGWHTAMITFELDEKGNLLRIDEYKVSSFGDDKQ
jgi:hypothetical protein